MFNGNGTRIIFFSACLAMVFLICGVTAPAAVKDAPMGSPDFSPSAQQPVGWRGDGTGKYPGATPPVHWGRVMKQLGDLKCSSAIPTNQSPANAVSAGVGFFTEWLVAVPISSAHVTNVITQELTPGEAALAPQEGDKIGETIWKRAQVDNSYIDVLKMNGPMSTGQAAYVQACLYAGKPTKIWFHYRVAHISTQGVAAFWLNGKLNKHDPSRPYLLLDLQPGWNRFLFKIKPRYGAADFPNSCFVQCRFWPAEEPREYEQKNIAWITPMPGLSEAMPVIVGDKIFTTAHPYSLVCVDKKTGKVLWVRPSATYDAATAEDRKTKPELFAKLDDLAKKREDYYGAFVSGTLATNQTAKAEAALEEEMDKLMVEVDQKYKKPKEQGEPSWWEIPTPVSDGKNICIFLERGISACYDLDGKRRWIRYEPPKHQHHGWLGSPVFADGKLVILDGTITAIDGATGIVSWSVIDKMKTSLWFGSLSRTVIGGVEFVVCPGGASLIRAKDGKIFSRGDCGAEIESTPVCHDGAVLQAGGHMAWITPLKPDAGEGVAFQKVLSMKSPKETHVVPGFYQGHWLEASPVVHEGLAYLVRCWGTLVVLDLATMDVVYEQVLPLDLFQIWDTRIYFGASVALAGDYIYLMGSTGVTIVIKPGRKYEEVARNRIQYLGKEGRMLGAYAYPEYYNPRCAEYQDCTMTATPIFEGNRMYFRGMENLYCIEQNVWAVQSVDSSRGEAPLTVKFDAGKSRAMPGRKVAKYAWDFSDGSTGSPQVAANIAHTYANPGTYIAKLTVTDDKGATDDAETTIIVSPADAVPPVITSVAARGETNVTVQFGEKVEQVSAGNAENYAISRDIKVLFAAIGSDPSEVNLITTPLAEDVKYELTVKNIKDCARKQNTINAKSMQSFCRFRSPPDEDGYVREWLMLPPIPADTTNKTDVFARECFAGQATCAPNEGDKVSVNTNELAWKVSRSAAAVVPLEYKTAKMEFFRVAYIVCNEDIPDVRLRIGGAQDGSLWSLNGQELIRTQVSRSLGRDLHASGPVTLKKGRNVLMARLVINGYPGGNFCARFVDKDGNPVRDYNVSVGAAVTNSAASSGK